MRFWLKSKVVEFLVLSISTGAGVVDLSILRLKLLVLLELLAVTGNWSVTPPAEKGWLDFIF